MNEKYYEEIRLVIREVAALERVSKKIGDLNEVSAVTFENEVLEDMIVVEKEKMFNEYKEQCKVLDRTIKELSFFNNNSKDSIHNLIVNQIKAYIKYFTDIDDVKLIQGTSLNKKFKDNEIVFTFTILNYLESLERTFKPSEDKDKVA